ncbi:MULTISPECIES: hypothetical protein [unclassified Rhodosalinus]|uniref:hypothetical protein n=1 Tax=unclassified Rhodosalinus TaxID=2630183 RepID=UPI00352408F6
MKLNLKTVISGLVAASALSTFAVAQGSGDMESNMQEGDYRIEIMAKGDAPVGYRIFADGNIVQLHECGIGMEDSVYDNNAAGTVFDGRDCFQVSGTLRNIQVTDRANATILVNGEEV